MRQTSQSDGLEELCSDSLRVGQFFLLGGSAYPLDLQQVATQSTLAPLYQYRLLVPLLAASFFLTDQFYRQIFKQTGQ